MAAVQLEPGHHEVAWIQEHLQVCRWDYQHHREGIDVHLARYQLQPVGHPTLASGPSVQLNRHELGSNEHHLDSPSSSGVSGLEEPSEALADLADPAASPEGI
jgi:hypothetical protein